MLSRNHPDRIRVAFDDHRLLANAGLILPVTLALRLGLSELVDRHVDLGDSPGRANAGDKLLTLVASALAGGDCIDAADVLRSGGTASAIGCVVKAPSTLGDLPAQLPLGPCPPTGPGEPGVVGPGLVGWGRTRGRPVDHRPGLHHLRDLRSGQGGSTASRLHRPAGLSPHAGRGRWHWRGADGPALAQRELSHPLNSQWACRTMREARRRSYPSEHFSLTHPSAASRMQSMAPS